MQKVSFEVNGLPHEVMAGKDEVLLDFLRKDLDLIGTKQSCDRKGQCGACTVIVDNKAVLSCLTKLSKLDGAKVITVEGLGTPDNPHLIQHAYVLSGAVQCGFCTPGLIMATKALLDQDPDPDDETIKKALRRNLCRCTGYVKIIEAVKLAARFLRGETTPEEVAPAPDAPVLGVSHPRPSAYIKACGVARFTADYNIPGALEIAVVRSEVPHALIKSIDTSAAEAMPGVEGVLTGQDILQTGTNILKYMVVDRPVLCTDRVRYIGDAMVAVAARTKAEAEAAAAAVKIELDPQPVLETPEQAMAEDAFQLHADNERPNLCFHQPQIKGDAEAALADSETVIETVFNTQCIHQAPLEPESTVAYWDYEDPEDPHLVVVGRSINIHHHLHMLQEAVGWENMSYEEAFVGGQFGLKIDVGSEGICAAAAVYFKKPVRYIPSLHESMLLTPKRHPFRMEVKLAADSQGKLTAYFNDILVDNGAYHSMGHVVVLRALMMLSGSYNIPNVKADSRLVYTNNPWGAAARGAGPPQANFALEVAMEMLADKMGQDSLEFRLNNFLEPGQSKSTGHEVTEWPIPELMESIRPHYERAKKDAAAAQSDKIKRGVGLATGSFGIGGPGDQGFAACELDTDGGVSVYAAAADPGEGNDSMLTQIAAEITGIPLSKVRLYTRSTDLTAASGPAAGSRITYMIGGAAEDALKQLKAAMDETGAKTGPELEAAGKPARYLGTKKMKLAGALDPETGQGPSMESQVHAVQLVELEVDTESGEVKIVKMTTAVDAGPVLNPNNLTGQLEGGADMGVGLALREKYVAGETKDWRSFKFPTMATSFPQEVIIRETPRPNGTLGCTGVGEMCLVPTAPAVINGIKHAIGAFITDLPATPDKVLAALGKSGS
ncbi:MAG: molybdopterin-dependent oxidoreductase [Desulfarculaceae bacterium]|nr:molybdopterin-dependent oxidoreductase [Desulfarculaceae bacterium]MCF8070773.1 molybdopterin-dependent oxidoreductase [Desulfarculaceae bacterium]MCF8102210.1 molybdopterin-dependent oxidoreductase [Desulfarculaceae bacterium]MCF8116991.1 molybdopterin-dependent oxidoreductase [Desulfarculaceae bacterium]